MNNYIAAEFRFMPSIQSYRLGLTSDLLFVPEFYLGLAICVCNILVVKQHYKRCVNKTKNISIIFLWAYVLLMALPSVIVFANYSNKIASPLGFMFVQTFPIFYILGHTLFQHIFTSNNSEKKISHLYSLEYCMAFNNIVWSLIICAVIFCVYFLIFEEVPLLKILNEINNKADREEIRLAIYKSNIIVQFLHSYFVRFCLPFCFLYVCWIYKKYDIKSYKYISIFLAIFGIFFSILSLERSQILFFTSILLMSFFSFEKVKNYGRIVILVGLVVISFGFVTINQYGFSASVLANPLFYVMKSFINRVILDPSFMTYVAFDFFPSEKEALSLSNIKFLSLLGVEYRGVSSLGIVGDGWVSFKFFGVILYPIIIGFFLAGMDKILQEKDNVVAYSCFIILIMDSIVVLYSQLFSVMFISGILSICALSLYNNKIKRRFFNKFNYKDYENICVLNSNVSSI